ncbi:UNKNOWN [Stylonychia lemnae]|uniref:Uncharacterized protein n=1 Tax=Stylonychia lemnae TaxID=5949 RepID=A0A078BA91_STYLE|nr:UNKNOWN [Stylonychia lemnae]|eukprot:CDW91445.1 UNKNOWN [Stylonychia lemnae]
MESTTQTITQTQSQPQIHTFEIKKKQSIKWAEDTIDNEHLGRKKSKICCQYEKPVKHPDEESDNSSCCDSDKEDERNSYDRPPKHMRKHQHKNHDHDHDHDHTKQ